MSVVDVTETPLASTMGVVVAVVVAVAVVFGFRVRFLPLFPTCGQSDNPTFVGMSFPPSVLAVVASRQPDSFSGGVGGAEIFFSVSAVC